MTPPTNREVAEEIASMRHMMGSFELVERIESALAAAEARGRAEGEESMRERAAKLPLNYISWHMRPSAADIRDELHAAIRALPLSAAPAKQEDAGET